DQQGQGLVADRRALRRRVAVLDEAEPEPVAPGRGAVDEAPAGKHRAGAVGRALGHADAPGQLAEAQLGRPGQGRDDVEGDADRLQRRPRLVRGTVTHGPRSAVRTRSARSSWMRPLLASTLASPGPRLSGPPSRSWLRPPASAIIRAPAPTSQ